MYRWLRFSDGFLLSMVWTLHMVFHIQVVGLSPFFLVLMGTVYEVSVSLFEVPTGVVADVYSRKLSVLIGYTVIGAALLLEGLFPVFWPVVVAQVFLGIGETFVSGAREAWVTDETAGSTGESEMNAGTIMNLGSQSELVGRIFGAWAGLPFLAGGLQNVMVAAAIGFWLTVVVFARIMRERGFHKSHEERNLWTGFKNGWRTVRGSRYLSLILIAAVVMGVASEGYDRLSNKHILSLFQLPASTWWPAEAWWSLLSSLAVLVTLALNRMIRRRVDYEDSRSLARAVLLLAVGVVVGVALFAWAPSLWTVLPLFVLIRAFRRTIDPLMAAWVNLYAPASQRATVLSFNSQSHSFGEIAGGPLVGLLAQLTTVRAALFASAGLLAPCLVPLTALTKTSEPSTTIEIEKPQRGD